MSTLNWPKQNNLIISRFQNIEVIRTKVFIMCITNFCFENTKLILKTINLSVHTRNKDRFWERKKRAWILMNTESECSSLFCLYLTPCDKSNLRGGGGGQQCMHALYRHFNICVPREIEHWSTCNVQHQLSQVNL